MRNGIDFVPLDVTLDDKFKLIEAEYGIKGFAVIVKLFQKIYGGEGYYCEWTNDVALLFSKDIGLGGNVVSQIVESALRRGLFHDGLYKMYHILTSRGIQKRYLKAQSRKVRVEIKKAYLLVELAQIPQNVTILNENVTDTSENVTDTATNKTNINKVNLNKTNIGAAADTQHKREFSKKTQDVINHYEQNIAPITPIVAHSIDDWLGNIDADVVIYAIDEAAKLNKRNWKYIEAIIRNNHIAGRTTLAAVEDANRKRKGGRDKTPSIFDDTGTDYDEIENLIREKM